ncbi:hypothetical protein ACTU45_14095 [Streptomyces sp. 24-1644]|uniref:hypothetical protein n=1 Tax=Streptomyces sp. 24-1644 TaxID=3457315 RepID=UPI003FA6C655
MTSNPEMAWMEVVRLLTQDGQATRQGALSTMSRLCEQDPTLVEATAHIVRSVMSQWEEDGSSSPALEEAARQLLARLDTPLMDKPTP